MTDRANLVFVSPRFLFPADSGGKIRTGQILRGLKGGRFRVTLIMPSTDRERKAYASEIESVCDEFVSWNKGARGDVAHWLRRLIWLTDELPVPVKSDWDLEGARTVVSQLSEVADVAVFDFPHSAILAPEAMTVPSVMFTHNVEAEIFRRHWEVARSPLRRWVWKSQFRKMCRFERATLSRFKTVIAVSERDCRFFETEYGISNCRAIPTGVDTEYFEYAEPSSNSQVVFCGSMDWMANVDGVEFFAERIWPRIVERVPGARMKVVGRAPSGNLVRRIQRMHPQWEFTGFVDDIRDHVRGAGAFVIPLRVGGGTRIKAFEAMAMGTPVVSTRIGVEGLPVYDGQQFLAADEPEEFAERVAALLDDSALRDRVSRTARDFVQSSFGFRRAATVFESICDETLQSAFREKRYAV